MDKERKIDLEAELKGTSFKVYVFFLKKNRSLGVREVQRGMNLSSPSVALHHLEKLRRLGLLNKDRFGRYSIKEQVKVGVLNSFLRFGRIILPRYLFYAVFFSSVFILYGIQSLAIGSTPDFVAIVLAISASIISWYEALKIWRERIF
ncbi:MAG: hypothetical protein NWE86_08005 [Candidatus Bathyarchaeota archaeon]|nr:hypothetical protein [Candidatus Bathyarchaeota archaeon]